jgi:hypothetical protein
MSPTPRVEHSEKQSSFARAFILYVDVVVHQRDDPRFNCNLAEAKRAAAPGIARVGRNSAAYSASVSGVELPGKATRKADRDPPYAGLHGLPKVRLFA